MRVKIVFGEGVKGWEEKRFTLGEKNLIKNFQDFNFELDLIIFSIYSRHIPGPEKFFLFFLFFPWKATIWKEKLRKKIEYL